MDMELNYILVYAKKTTELDNGNSIMRGDLIEALEEDVQNALQSGEIIHIDDSLYQEYNQKLNTNYETYKKKIEETQESDKPIYKEVYGQRSYDIKELEQERSIKDQELRNEYDAQLSELKEESVKEQALTVDILSKSDEQSAAAKIEDFKFNTEVDSIDEAISELLKFMDFAESSGVRAVKPHMAEIYKIINDNVIDSSKASIYKTQIKEAILDNEVMNIEKVFEQYPKSGSIGTKANIGAALERSRSTHTKTEV